MIRWPCCFSIAHPLPRETDMIPRRVYVDRMTEPSAGATTTSVDRALRHAPNPATEKAGAAEFARNLRDLLAPALTRALTAVDESGDRPPLDVVDIGANPIDGDP